MKPAAVSTFESYVSSVEDRATAALGVARVGQSTQVPLDLLDGQAAVALRETVPLKARRDTGAFFSSSDLRAAAFAACSEKTESAAPTLDPAVGAGDLLIEAAKALPIDPDLEQTLRHWGGLLHGRDIDPTFVRLTKARLVLLAFARGAGVIGSALPPTLSDVLPGIQECRRAAILSVQESSDFVSPGASVGGCRGAVLASRHAVGPDVAADGVAGDPEQPGGCPHREPL